MKLTSALDEYSLLQRRRLRGEQGSLASLALSALREYLVERSEIADTTGVTSHELFQFLLDHYPSEEEPEADVALELLSACAGFARWLAERGETGTAGFAAAEERLRSDLPRVMEALTLLREHTQADSLTPVIPVSQLAEKNGHADTGHVDAVEAAGSGDEEEPSAAGVLGDLSSGLDRTMTLDKINYDAAQLDYFTIRRSQEADGKGVLALEASSREILGEGLAEPVRIPAEAAALLRPDDILYAEIAPGPDGWEILEAFGIRPGGYDE